MEQTWHDSLLFTGVAATFDAASATDAASTRGRLGRISARRIGAGDGTVTLQVYADSGLQDLVLEAEFELSGNGDVDVVGGAYEPAYRAPDGLYGRCLDSADNGDNIAFVFNGSVAAGA